MRRAKPGAVTIRSVAAACGVSVATVSRVMAGSDKVTAARRKQVLAVAARLGYQPNAAAQSLATGTSGMVGVIVPNLSNPYFYDVLRGLGRASAADGYRMMVSDSMEDAGAERGLAEELLRFTDALVVLAPREDLGDLAGLGVAKPITVLIGPRTSAWPAATLPDVTVDNLGGMVALYEHLAGLGHRRVVYLAGPAQSSQDAVRVAAGKHAADVEVMVVRAGDGTIEAGYRAADGALAQSPTAIACFNDLIALGVLRWLGERGVRVPEEVSVTGFDDIDFSAYSSPKLTTVRTPREALGRRGWEVVRTLLSGEEVTTVDPLPAELVPRQSTGPARTASPPRMRGAPP